MILVVCGNRELGSRPPSLRSFQVPYFVRQPYVTPVSAPPQTEDRSSGTDILELAKNVLAFETGEGENRPFRIRDPLRPGGQGAMILELALDHGSPARTINLAASELSGAGSLTARELDSDQHVDADPPFRRSGRCHGDGPGAARRAAGPLCRNGFRDRRQVLGDPVPSRGPLTQAARRTISLRISRSSVRRRSFRPLSPRQPPQAFRT